MQSRQRRRATEKHQGLELLPHDQWISGRQAHEELLDREQGLVVHQKVRRTDVRRRSSDRLLISRWAARSSFREHLGRRRSTTLTWKVADTAPTSGKPVFLASEIAPGRDYVGCRSLSISAAVISGFSRPWSCRLLANASMKARFFANVARGGSGIVD